MAPFIIISPKILKVLSIAFPIGGITIWPFIVVKSSPTEELITHEKIHIAQQEELFVFLFYILYGFYFLKNWFYGETVFDAYLTIPFEKEAYKNQHDAAYLETRKRYSWRKYI